MTNQPEWKHVGTIGDVDPIAHGGGFVYVDTTGVYAPQIAWFEPGSDEEWHKTGGATKLQVYRFDLDPPRFRTNGAYHEATGEYERVWFREWFVEELPSVARSTGTTAIALLRGLFSKDPMKRAMAYWAIIGNFGAHEFDSYPIDMTEDEAYAKYAAEMAHSLARR